MFFIVWIELISFQQLCIDEREIDLIKRYIPIKFEEIKIILVPKFEKKYNKDLYTL